MSIKNQVESIIFLGGDENKIKDLAKFFKISIEDMLKILLELKDDRKDTGINIEVDSEIVYLSIALLEAMPRVDKNLLILISSYILHTFNFFF